jgi:coatomer subunit beta
MAGQDTGFCTVLLHNKKSEPSSDADLVRLLESKDVEDKISGLKEIITMIAGGEQLPKLMMSVIKFCIHTENKFLKKLLYMYWEVVEKVDSRGALIPEMILVCQSLKNDLSHPNEYVRGSSLRFLCKIKQAAILESLIPAIIANLDHRHSYVRKNAVLCVYSIFEFSPDMVEDAPTLIEQFLATEANPCAKRNAFLMLFYHDQKRAVTFLDSILESITSLGEGFQLLVLELIRKVCRGNPHAKSHYIRCVHALLNSTSHAVSFEGANTLVSLSGQPTAVRAAVNTYCKLLSQQSDHNVKLIILNRLGELKKRNEKILREMLLDILRVLESPNREIRAVVLRLAVELTSARTVEAVVQLLKKELQKTTDSKSSAKGSGKSYRKMVVEALHQFSVKFPDVVGKVVLMLLNNLNAEDDSALDVIYYVRNILSHYPALRAEVLTRLMESFDDIRSVEVYRVTLWIFGEFAEGSVLEAVLQLVCNAIEPVPLLTVVEEKTGEEDVKDVKEQKSHRQAPSLNADGSYASQSASDQRVVVISGSTDAKSTKIRDLILNGEYFLATSLVSALTKIVIRSQANLGLGTPASNAIAAKALLIYSSILRYGISEQAPKRIDTDSVAHLVMCTKLLLETKHSPQREIFVRDGKEVLHKLVANQIKADTTVPEEKKSVELVTQADDCISIRQLKTQVDYEFLDDDDTDLNKALGGQTRQDMYAKLNRVYQLTGFDDPVYVEAQLNVVNYDIVLETFVVNQTETTLQNCSIELHTRGDLKVIDRPRTYTLAPGASLTTQINIKVTSTESGVIFGNVCYDSPNGAVKTLVDLNNIHMDIIDYIAPATCSDADFRQMWSDFEWENKLAVITDEPDLVPYLDHITRITNMRCMTNDNTMAGTCNFLAANLYARSIFGEDALLNMSVEKQASGKITGYIRIRSKTQGIALSLGERITVHQRSSTKPGE